MMRECPSAYKEKKGLKFGSCCEYGEPHFVRECPKLKDGGRGDQQNIKGRENAGSGYLSDSRSLHDG